MSIAFCTLAHSQGLLWKAVLSLLLPEERCSSLSPALKFSDWLSTAPQAPQFSPALIVISVDWRSSIVDKPNSISFLSFFSAKCIRSSSFRSNDRVFHYLIRGGSV